MIVEGAIVPHAPLLTLPENVAGDGPAAAVSRAVCGLAFGDDVDALVVLSPHGRATGVYSGGNGSLRGFGLEGPSVEANVDLALVREIATGWRAGVLTGELDHGAVVPLALLEVAHPVVVAALAEGTDPKTVVEQGRSFARAVAGCAARVAFVASVNTAAALTARAPLGLRPAAIEAEGMVLDWLTTGSGDADSVLAELAAAGGSCGAGPLAAFGEVFAGRAEVHRHESPHGVGYLVATATATAT